MYVAFLFRAKHVNHNTVMIHWYNATRFTVIFTWHRYLYLVINLHTLFWLCFAKEHISKFLACMLTTNASKPQIFCVIYLYFYAVSLKRFWFFHADDWYNLDILLSDVGCVVPPPKAKGENYKCIKFVMLCTISVNVDYNRKVTGNNFHTDMFYIYCLNTIIPCMWIIVVHI